MSGQSKIVLFLEGLKDIFSDDYEVYMVLEELHNHLFDYNKYKGMSEVKIKCRKVFEHNCNCPRIGFEHVQNPMYRDETYFFICTNCKEEWEIKVEMVHRRNHPEDVKWLEGLSKIVKEGKQNGRR